MSEEVKDKKDVLKNWELGRGGAEIVVSAPMEFNPNKIEKAIMTTDLEKQIGSMFKSICDDTVMTLVRVAENGKLIVELFFQAEPYDKNNLGKKFKAVIPHELEARSGNTVDSLKMLGRSKTSVLSLTEDAKRNLADLVLSEHCDRNTRKVNWNLVYSERFDYRDVFENGTPKRITYNYGVVILDPARVIARLYGEKNPNGAYYQYVIEGITVRGVKECSNGVKIPIYQMKVSRLDREAIDKDFSRTNPVSGNIFGATLATVD